MYLENKLWDHFCMMIDPLRALPIRQIQTSWGSLIHRALPKCLYNSPTPQRPWFLRNISYLPVFWHTLCKNGTDPIKHTSWVGTKRNFCISEKHFTCHFSNWGLSKCVVFIEELLKLKLKSLDQMLWNGPTKNVASSSKQLAWSREVRRMKWVWVCVCVCNCRQKRS